MIDEVVLTEKVTWINGGRYSWMRNALLDVYERGGLVSISDYGCVTWTTEDRKQDEVFNIMVDLDHPGIELMCSEGLLRLERIMLNDMDELYLLTELGKEVARTLLVMDEIELGVDQSDNGTG